MELISYYIKGIKDNAIVAYYYIYPLFRQRIEKIVMVEKAVTQKSGKHGNRGIRQRQSKSLFKYSAFYKKQTLVKSGYLVFIFCQNTSSFSYAAAGSLFLPSLLIGLNRFI